MTYLCLCQAVLDTTHKACRGGEIFARAHFNLIAERANISARRTWCGNNIGGSFLLLAFDGERILEWHILTKYFAGRPTAVDILYSIPKAAIFNAGQLILGITASRYVESLQLKENFISVSDFEFDPILRNWSNFDTYIGISFDAKTDSEERGWIIRKPWQLANVLSLKTCVKLYQPSFARCMFLLIKRNYQ